MPVDAAQTPTAYGEGKPAIINNSFLDRAGIDPTTSVFQDDPNSPTQKCPSNLTVPRDKRRPCLNSGIVIQVFS